MGIRLRSWSGVYIDAAGVEHDCLIVQIMDTEELVFDAETGDEVPEHLEYFKVAPTSLID